MSNTFGGYHLDFAIAIRRTLIYEPHNNDDLFEKVWQPTKVFLEKIASSVQGPTSHTLPKTITCFLGKQYSFPQQSLGLCANLYIVNPAKEVAYLGTVFNEEARNIYLGHEILRLKMLDSDQAKILQNATQETIIKDRYFFRIIPAGGSLAYKKVNRSVKRVFPKKLAKIPIIWLSKTQGIILDRKIWQEVKLTAKKYPESEYLKKFEQDYS